WHFQVQHAAQFDYPFSSSFSRLRIPYMVNFNNVNYFPIFLGLFGRAAKLALMLFNIFLIK
ncbi:hypothetical protein, partial [Paenibacillus larvae]|uniref:hypothetical protein n=1 Tax=Paenibacillus larvae TaxID=1464 RepID=UPI00227E8072